MRAIFHKPYRLLDYSKTKGEQAYYESRTLVEPGTYQLAEVPNPYFGSNADNWWVISGTTLGMSTTSWIESKSISIEHPPRALS